MHNGYDFSICLKKQMLQNLQKGYFNSTDLPVGWRDYSKGLDQCQNSTKFNLVQKT